MPQPAAPAPRTRRTGRTLPQAAPQQPTFRAGINFVRVDAIVTDGRGNPVADLKPTDFEVTEDGKPQTIEKFRLVKVDGNAAAEVSRRADPHA